MTYWYNLVVEFLPPRHAMRFALTNSQNWNATRDTKCGISYWQKAYLQLTGFVLNWQHYRESKCDNFSWIDLYTEFHISNSKCCRKCPESLEIGNETWVRIKKEDLDDATRRNRVCYPKTKNHSLEFFDVALYERRDRKTNKIIYGGDVSYTDAQREKILHYSTVDGYDVDPEDQDYHGTFTFGDTFKVFPVLTDWATGAGEGAELLQLFCRLAAFYKVSSNTIEETSNVRVLLDNALDEYNGFIKSCWSRQDRGIFVMKSLDACLDENLIHRICNVKAYDCFKPLEDQYIDVDEEYIDLDENENNSPYMKTALDRGRVAAIKHNLGSQLYSGYGKPYKYPVRSPFIRFVLKGVKVYHNSSLYKYIKTFMTSDESERFANIAENDGHFFIGYDQMRELRTAWRLSHIEFLERVILRSEQFYPNGDGELWLTAFGDTVGVIFVGPEAALYINYYIEPFADDASSSDDTSY